MTSPRHLVLRAADACLVLECPPGRLPVVLHWGADPGDLDEASLSELGRAVRPGVVPNDLDDPPGAPGLLPEHADGWTGRPGLAGSWSGRGWSSRFSQAHTTLTADPRGGGTVVSEAVDDQGGQGAVSLRTELEMSPEGVLRHRATVTAVRAPGPGDTFAVEGLRLVLPVPAQATELFDLAGRWGRERTPQRMPMRVGVHSRENRRGRTGPEAPLVLAAGTSDLGLRTGQVWAVHVAWSGNHLTYAEKLSTGTAVLGGGELLLPGEVRLAEGDSYTSPWVYAAHGTGLDGVANRIHALLRSRPNHPATPRPVVLNTWEAVYFDHDLGRLTELAERGAEVGVERFVLDDGWFRHRRSDHAGLGDWYVDETVWPHGLHPLIEVVHDLGMEFGLWVEPEMINPNSDLARSHPEWILGTGGRTPPLSRSQQVLDLGHPDAYDYLLERLDALLSEYPIAYLKWDHNRDLLDAGSGADGLPGVHTQTLAVYRLLDELRAKHPRVEIESCSSGGLRVDLGILERTDRVWGSDCIDALERQQIQRWTTQLLPPELIGSHVGEPRSHTTGRTQDLAFRAGTALFGSFGIEWDLTRASDEERKQLASWVELYKELRPLLHTGTVVRDDQHDPSSALHGVVAPDGSDALYALVQLTAPDTSVPDPVRLAGLDPDRRYRVSAQHPGDLPTRRGPHAPPWLATGVTLPGSVLRTIGLRAPAMFPEQLLLIRAEAV